MPTSDVPASPVNFLSPPLAEVAVSVQFAPIEGLSSYRSGELYSRWAAEYPNVSQLPQLPSSPPLNGEEGFFLQLGATVGSRLWFESVDRHFLIQMQDDRLVVNWRRLDATAIYPRYQTVRRRFTAAWEDLLSVMGGESNVHPSQVEVCYVNTVGYAPNEVLAGWKNPLSLQTNGRFTASFEQEVALDATSAARRLTALGGEYGDKPRTDLTIAVRAEPADPLRVMDAIDACRAHVVCIFKEFTDPTMHSEWGEQV